MGGAARALDALSGAGLTGSWAGKTRVATSEVWRSAQGCTRKLRPSSSGDVLPKVSPAHAHPRPSRAHELDGHTRDVEPRRPELLGRHPGAPRGGAAGSRGPPGATGSPEPMVGRATPVPQTPVTALPQVSRGFAHGHRGPSGEARDTRRAGAAAGVEAGGEGLPRGWWNLGGRARLLMLGLLFRGGPLRHGAGLPPGGGSSRCPAGPPCRGPPPVTTPPNPTLLQRGRACRSWSPPRLVVQRSAAVSFRLLRDVLMDSG